MIDLGAVKANEMIAAAAKSLRIYSACHENKEPQEGSGPASQRFQQMTDCAQKKVDCGKTHARALTNTATKTARTLSNGAGGHGIDGSLTSGSFDKIITALFHVLSSEALLLSDLSFVDVGSGDGIQCLRAARHFKSVVGIEVDPERFKLSLYSLRGAIEALAPYEDRGLGNLQNVFLEHGDVSEVGSFGANVVFGFDFGMPEELMENYASTFNKSSSQWLISFHPADKVTRDFGFLVDQVGNEVSVTMSGSGEGKTARIFKRRGGGGGGGGGGDKLLAFPFDDGAAAAAKHREWLQKALDDASRSSRSKRRCVNPSNR